MLDLPQPRVVHGGRMKCRHKPSTLQTHHELLPAHTGVMRCIAQPLRGSTTTKRASGSTYTNTNTPNRLHTHTHPPKRLAHPRSPIPPLSTLTSRATHAQDTRTPLHPAALASVPYGVVLVRVRVPHSSSNGLPPLMPPPHSSSDDPPPPLPSPLFSPEGLPPFMPSPYSHTPSLDTDLTRNTRAPHLIPQHWLLCHMGL